MSNPDLIEQEGISKSEIGVIASETQPLSEELFQAYLEGNGLVPNVPLGIGIQTLHIVLASEQDWEKFVATEFSDSQVARLGKLMTNMHAAKGIPIIYDAFDPGHHNHNARGPERLRMLWGSAKSFVLKVIHEYMKAVKADSPDLEVSSDGLSNIEVARDIEVFMKDQKNIEKVKTLKEIVDMMYNYLKEPAVLLQLQQYKIAFGPPYVAENTVKAKAILQPIIFELKTQMIQKGERYKTYWDLIEPQLRIED
jgi:hypothetical protein